MSAIRTNPTLEVDNQSSNELSIELCPINIPSQITTEFIHSLNQTCDNLEDADANTVLFMHLIPADISVNEDEETQVDVYLVSKWEKLIRRLEQLKKPLICAAEGEVGGLGVALLLTADYRFAAGDCHFSLVNQNGAIMPGTVLQRLAHQIGSGKARKLALLGCQLTAEQACDYGLVDEVVENPATAAVALIRSLTANQVKDISVRRQLLLEAFCFSYEDSLGSYLAACDRLLRSQAMADVE